jgi:hypothetical protein
MKQLKLGGKLVMVVVDAEGSILKGCWFIWIKAFYRNFGQEQCCISFKDFQRPKKTKYTVVLDLIFNWT